MSQEHATVTTAFQVLSLELARPPSERDHGRMRAWCERGREAWSVLERTRSGEHRATLTEQVVLFPEDDRRDTLRAEPELVDVVRTLPSPIPLLSDDEDTPHHD